MVASLARRTTDNAGTNAAAAASAAATFLAASVPLMLECAVDLKVSQLRMATVDALAAAAAALGKEGAGGPGGELRAACVSKLESMRDDDRAPDVRGAAGRALAGLTTGAAAMDI